MRYLRTLPRMRRLREWTWLHLQFKFTPWALLRTGRQTLLGLLNDTEYAEYLSKLEG